MSIFKTYNPCSGEFLKEHTYASGATVHASIEKLHIGFLKWKKYSFKERQNKLFPLIDLLNQTKNELAQSITTEMGKPFLQSVAEINKSIKATEHLLTQSYDELNVKTINTSNKTDQTSHQIIYKPKGVILGVMPWNFPLWQAVRMIIPALLVGNTVLLKHSEITPTVGELLKRLFQKIDLDDIFDHHIFEHTLTESIISNEYINGVSLTGSVKAGHILSEYAGKYMKRGVFELGGSDAHLVLDDANLVETAKTIAQSRMQNSGQSCIAAKRVIVDKKISLNFIEHLKNQFDQFVWGDLNDKTTTIGPLAAARFKLEDQKHFDFIKSFSKILYERFPDENVVSSLQKDQNHQAFVPLRIIQINSSNKLTHDQEKYLKTVEFFSPTLLVFEYENLEEALSLANQTQFGLGGSIYSENIHKAQALALEFESGMVAINNTVVSNVSLPFGGVKASGIGRELGVQGFFEFTDIQVVSATHFS